MLCATLWGQWLRWRREQTWLWFDDSNLECLQADRASQAQTATTLMNLGVPLEEINRVLDMGLDLSNNPYAKTIWMSRGFIPAELASTGFSEAMPPATGDEIKTIVREAIAEESARRKAIAKSEDKPRIPAKLFDEKEFFRDLEEILGPVYDDAVLAGIKQLEAEGMAIGFDPDESAAFQKFFKTKWNKVKTIPKRFQRHMKRTIGTQIGNGRTVAEIAKELEERFPISEKGWSMTIARTEVGDVIDGTRYLAMEAEEIPYHVWASSHDAAVRDGHDERDWAKDWAKIGEQFQNGLKYPHDPSGEPGNIICCRCVTFPLMEKPGKAKVSGPDEWEKRVKPGIVKLERRVYRALLPVYDKLMVKIIAALKAAN